MGANGSKGKGILEDPDMRNYRENEILKISNNIVVIEAKNKNAKVKLPEESHTPNRIYVAINKPATDKIGKNDSYAGKLKSIAVYGSDCKKLYEIHVDHMHGGMPEHYHIWENGHPVKAGMGKNAHNAAYPLTVGMKQLLQQVKSKVPHV
jgi:hypothetical protein